MFNNPHSEPTGEHFEISMSCYTKEEKLRKVDFISAPEVLAYDPIEFGSDMW